MNSIDLKSNLIKSRLELKNLQNTFKNKIGELAFKKNPAQMLLITKRL